MAVIDELKEMADQMRGLFNGREAQCARCGMPGKVGTGIEFFPNIPESGQLGSVTFDAQCDNCRAG
jgi:hypothetical protein